MKILKVLKGGHVHLELSEAELLELHNGTRNYHPIDIEVQVALATGFQKVVDACGPVWKRGLK